MIVKTGITIIDGTAAWPTDTPTTLGVTKCVPLENGGVRAVMISTVGTPTVYLAAYVIGGVNKWAPITSVTPDATVLNGYACLRANPGYTDVSHYALVRTTAGTVTADLIVGVEGM